MTGRFATSLYTIWQATTFCNGRHLDRPSVLYARLDFSTFVVFLMSLHPGLPLCLCCLAFTTNNMSSNFGGDENTAFSVVPLSLPEKNLVCYHHLPPLTVLYGYLLQQLSSKS
jgi:hypothetical protein